MIYDVIIIGGGPAGLNSAIYTTRAGKKTLVIEHYAIGGQAALTHEIVNYAGVKTATGYELTETMKDQAEAFGTEFVFDEITSLSLEGEIKTVNTEYSGTFSAKNIILAMGAKARELGVERERELTGKGISYCATCDGNFFKGKTVAIVGGGDTALTDVVYLKKMTEKVYIIHRRDEYRGSQSLINEIKTSENVGEILESVVTSLVGTPLETVEVKNRRTNEKRQISVDGLFVAVGNEPQTKLIKDVITLEDGYIVTDEEMRTNIPNVYAVGDIRKKALRQVITACADGAIASIHI